MRSINQVIPTIISQLINEEKSIKIGSTSPVRDFVFVEDTVEAFYRLSNSSESVGKEINIATGSGISIKEVIDLIGKILNKDVNVVTENRRMRPEKSEVDKLIGDNKRLYDIIGWKPEVSLEKGLEKTISWMLKNKSFYKTNIYNI